MPLWRIYCNPATFTKEQKQGIANAITKLYTDPPVGLPAFYVNVLFIPLKEDEYVFLPYHQTAKDRARATEKEGAMR